MENKQNFNTLDDQERTLTPEDIISHEKYFNNISVYHINNSKLFYDFINNAYENNPHGAFLTMDYSADDYENMDKIIINNGTAGVAIKEDGDIVSVFKNNLLAERDGIGKIGQTIMLESLKSGGNHLDCYDGYLPRMYGSIGFKPICKIKFNDDYAPADWNFERDGRPDVVFMAHPREPFEEILRKRDMNLYPPIAEDLKNAPYVDDYDEAGVLIDKYLEDK